MGVPMMCPGLQLRGCALSLPGASVCPARFILATLQQEEDAFWVLVRLLNHMGAAGFFVERTPGLSLFKAMCAPA